MSYQACYNWTLCWWCPPTPTAPQMQRTISHAAAERGWGSRKLGSIMAWTIRMRKNKNDHFFAKHFFFSRNDSHRERGNKNREQPQASWTYSHSGSWLARPYKPTSSKRISTCGSSAVDVEGFQTINSPAVVHILSPAKTWVRMPSLARCYSWARCSCPWACSRFSGSVYPSCPFPNF